jgi:hypothetical protein
MEILDSNVEISTTLKKVRSDYNNWIVHSKEKLRRWKVINNDNTG